jgi:protein kinase A
MLGGSDIKKMAAGLLHHHHTSPPPSGTPATSPTAEQEKHFIAQYSELQRVLPPDQIQGDQRNKALGSSSKGLTLRDFELVRTLGTGVFSSLSRLDGEIWVWGRPIGRRGEEMAFGTAC